MKIRMERFERPVVFLPMPRSLRIEACPPELLARLRASLERDLIQSMIDAKAWPEEEKP